MPAESEKRFELLRLPGWSRAEPIKMLFHLAREPFVDTCVTIDDWKTYKRKSGF